MGYEQFVKKIFPFIGNQYRKINEEGGYTPTPSTKYRAVFTLGMFRELRDNYGEDIAFCYSLNAKTGVIEKKSQEDYSIDRTITALQTDSNAGTFMFLDISTQSPMAFIGVDMEKQEDITSLNGKSPYSVFNLTTEQQSSITEDEMGFKNLNATLYLDPLYEGSWIDDDKLHDDEPILVLTYDEFVETQIEPEVEGE